jgi:SLT domain-containing protein
MRIEGVPITQYNDFLWLIAQESAGVPDARNSRSTARGLFQLLRAQYDLNPNGEKSFGNAIEECQGGIRYVNGRYHSAAAAKKFWQEHHWY